MLIETEYRTLLSTGQVVSKHQAASVPQNVAGGVVVIGNFDGVHLGHQALLAQGRKIADDNNIPLVVLTFHPHPRLYFAPNQESFLIASPEQKARLLRKNGADYVVSLKFDSDLANATADDFIRYVLVNTLRIHSVLVGDNFVFGKERGGNIDTLRQWGEKSGFRIESVSLAQSGALRVSSERVRQALRDGDMAQANDLLGRPWQLIGKVIPGLQRGRTIGFPTANISMGEYVHPAFGAYAARVILPESGAICSAIVNIGKRPTVGDFNPLVEAHLLDFSGDLYKQDLTIDFLAFIRAERKFESIDALKEQIAQDVTKARAVLDLS